MADKLAEICATKRLEVAERKLHGLPNWPTPSAPRGFEAALRSKSQSGIALIAEIKKASPSRGVIRAVGISHKSADGAACAIDVGCDVIMATLNPLHTVEAPVIARAASAGCGVLVKKALASGYAAPEDICFAASHPGVSSVVVGTVNPEHLADNARLLRDLQQHAR